MEKTFYRDPNNRLLGGISSGLGNYLNIDITLIRLGWVVLFFVTGGFIPVIYAIMWAIIPKENVTAIDGTYAEPTPTNNYGCLGVFLKIAFALVMLFALFIAILIIVCLFLLGLALIGGIINGELTLQTIDMWF